MRTFVKTLKTAKHVVLARVARVGKHVVTVVCTKVTKVLRAALSLRTDGIRRYPGLYSVHGMDSFGGSQSGLGCWQSPSWSWQPAAASRLAARAEAYRAWSRPPRS
ncbi:hypothetical protein JCM17478_22700 [Thermopirellula anaerolimosa]